MTQIADISLQMPQKHKHGVPRAFLAKLIGIGSQTKFPPSDFAPIFDGFGAR